MLLGARSGGGRCARPPATLGDPAGVGRAGSGSRGVTLCLLRPVKLVLLGRQTGPSSSIITRGRVRAPPRKRAMSRQKA